MKNQHLQEEFIRLRALGVSYDKIAKSISVSKPTLLKWGKACADQVTNELYCNVENLLEQYSVIKLSRIQAFAHCLQKALDELAKRDFNSLSIKDLLSVSLLLENKLKEEVNVIKHVSEACGFERDIFDESLPTSY